MKLKEIIKEGGAALAKAGVIRINRQDIPMTIDYVSQISGIPKEDMNPLGSTGKMPTSGDIDLAIDISQHNAKEVHQRMARQLQDDEAVYNPGTKVGSYAIPIAGDREKGLVQVDFMYVKNPEWAKFAFFSAGNESRYKGTIRTELIRGVAAALNVPGIDHFEYDDEGQLLIRVGRTMDRAEGLKRILQHRPAKKHGQGYIKTMKTLSMDDFKAAYPDIEVHDDTMTIDDPSLVIQILFGKNVKLDDLRTAEQVLSIIKRKFNKKEQERIFTLTKQILRGKKDLKRPPELQE